MIKKLYDKCVTWAGYKYAKQILAIEAFIESSFFPIPPDVMIIPMVVSKRNEFIRIALIATFFFSVRCFVWLLYWLFSKRNCGRNFRILWL